MEELPETVLPEQLSFLRELSTTMEVVYFRELGSTNDYALKLLETRGVATTLVLAEHQKEGRGRGGKKWIATEESLTFSLLYPLKKIPCYGNPPPVSLCVGVVLWETLCDLLPELSFKIKWPNDLYLGSRKLAGILVETQKEGIVVGIGLNIREVKEKDMERVASLEEGPEKIVTKYQVLEAFLKRWHDPGLADRLFGTCQERFELTEGQIANDLKNIEDSKGEFAKHWKKGDYLAGKKVEVQNGNKRHIGVVKGISLAGALLLEQGETTLPVYAGTVTTVYENQG
ncbi:MAG: biotin--[acetyl-CoA-carboxylase] ligase [Pirellulaceae bacterium]|nr:biotin--[acetyl-CoA-carboxylase] ligase [Pirellulaceae bacterium]